MKNLLRADLAMIFREKFYWISVAVSLGFALLMFCMGHTYPLFDRRAGTQDMIGFFGNAIIFPFLIFAAARHFCRGIPDRANCAKLAAGYTRTQIFFSLTLSGLCALAVRYAIWLLFAFVCTGANRFVLPAALRNEEFAAVPTLDGIAAELWYAVPGPLVYLAFCVMLCALTKKRTAAAILTLAALLTGVYGALLLPYISEMSEEFREITESGDSVFDEEAVSFLESEGSGDTIGIARKSAEWLASLSDADREYIVFAARLIPFYGRMEYQEYADDVYNPRRAAEKGALYWDYTQQGYYRGTEPENVPPPPKQIFEQCAYLAEAALCFTVGALVFRKKGFT